MRRFFPFVVLLLALLAGAAHAHKSSDAYLQLATGPEATTLRVDVALRDLELVVDIDADGDGRITWGEVRTSWPAIERYLIDRVQVAGCSWRAGAPALERRSDGSYAVLNLRSDCRPAVAPAIAYRVLAEVDPTHRGIVHVDWPGQVGAVRVLDPNRPESVGDAQASPSTSFLAEGVHHIVTGYDHVLFLLCLLLPSVMRRTPQGWQPVARLGDALRPVLLIVTAFTLAHSITLALAALKWVSLPSSFIEPAIAVTIVLAAFDNIRPIFGGRRGLVTFVFGLIHGFGFAGVLGELDLPAAAFAWALLRFNLGLELGQVAIVLAAAGLLFAVRRRPAYPRWVIGGGSLAAMAIGALWFVERTAEVSILSI